MKFLTFNYLLNKNIHLNDMLKLKKYNYSLYKIVNNSCIINLTYTSIYLYKLYKFFYYLNLKNIYTTFIYSFKIYNMEFIEFLLKHTINNYFNNLWIKGILTNKNIIKNINIIYKWIYKLLSFKYKFHIPKYILNVYKKFKYINKNLKYNNFSKFIFLFNLNYEKSIIKEGLYTNKFISGICDLNFNTEVVDFFIYSNSINEISLNLILKFIITSCINSDKIKLLKI